MLSEEDFYNRAENFSLFKDTEGKYYTYNEYKTLIEGVQKDKDNTLIYLYANNIDEQFSFIEQAKSKGYNVLLFDGQLDAAMLNLYEQKFDNTRFTRVDSDIIDNLIQKEEVENKVNEDDKKTLTDTFKEKMPKIDKTEFVIDVKPLGETSSPLILTQSEYMRRMKDLAKIQSGMSFYGDIPNTMNVVLNSDHKLIKQILSDCKSEANDKVARELIDLALLQNGMLKGEALNNFVKRSIDLIK